MRDTELSVSGLLGKSIDGADGLNAWICEFLIESDLSFVRYIAIADGLGACSEAKLVPSSTVAACSNGSEDLRIALTADEVGHMPSLLAMQSLDRATEISMHDAIHWKPYWDPGGATSEPHLHTWQRLRQAKCLIESGPDCSIVDLIVDLESWRIASAVIRVGHGPLSRLGALPVSKIDQQAGEIRLLEPPSICHRHAARNAAIGFQRDG